MMSTHATAPSAAPTVFAHVTVCRCADHEWVADVKHLSRRLIYRCFLQTEGDKVLWTSNSSTLKICSMAALKHLGTRHAAFPWSAEPGVS
jgi:hypothetical protein